MKKIKMKTETQPVTILCELTIRNHNKSQSTDEYQQLTRTSEWRNTSNGRTRMMPARRRGRKKRAVGKWESWVRGRDVMWSGLTTRQDRVYATVEKYKLERCDRARINSTLVKLCQWASASHNSCARALTANKILSNTGSGTETFKQHHFSHLDIF